MSVDMMAKLISKAASGTPRLRVSTYYDGTLHDGYVEEARRANEFSVSVDYKKWSADEGTFIPATMYIYQEDFPGIAIETIDGGKTLTYEEERKLKRQRVREQREIYAEKFENAPEWSPAVAEHTYQVDGITFSATGGLGSVPGNRNVWHEGAVVMMEPSVFLQLAADDEGHQEPTSIELEALVKQGYAIGIPFLKFIVDEDGDELPRVVGHEGRGRMRMVKRMIGDKPVPVHMFIGNGLRSNYLAKNPEVAKEMKIGLYSQSGTLVRRPVKEIYVSLDGRNNEPGKKF